MHFIATTNHFYGGEGGGGGGGGGGVGRGGNVGKLGELADGSVFLESDRRVGHKTARYTQISVFQNSNHTRET